MFTRVVELVSKQGKARELSRTINDKIVPILKKQPGFVDEILLVSDADSNRVLALSFWKSREDAERYQREQYNSVRETLQSVLEAEPVVRTRLRCIAQPATRSQLARLPERNLRMITGGEPTGSPYPQSEED